MSNSVEIKIDGSKLTPGRFEEVVRDFFTIICGVTRNISGVSKDDDWSIEVDSGSVILRARAENANARLAVEAVPRGFKALASGVVAPPEFFTKDEIKAAGRLAAITDGVSTNISIRNGGTPMILSSEIVKTVEAILSGETQTAIGSVEGIIEELRRKEGQPLTCSIRDHVYKRSIVCSFTKKDYEEEAYKAFYPPRRVLVSGLIHYAKEGYPIRIAVDLIRVIPDEHELPSVEDIQKFYSQ